MTKIDIVSGFLGAGKTTLIKKLLKEALSGEQVVLIENEFGQIGIDGGFLKEAGIEIKEMNSGCICCSLVGDFGASLQEVLEKYQPDRILIEPSGVGKLSDVKKAVEDVEVKTEVTLNSATAVVDASKCKTYLKNFGEFFANQIEHAGTIILSRTGQMSEEKIQQCLELIREHNKDAAIITTPWEQLDGKKMLETMEGCEDFQKKVLEEALAAREVKHSHDHHHEHGEECGCGCHGHAHAHDHDHEHGEECGCGCHGHEHDHDHHHDHHHEHGEECGCGCHGHEHAHDHDHHHELGEECGCGCHGHEHEHDHHHHHEHGEECGCGCHGHEHDHDHDHHHEHGEECGCGCHNHDHDHHHHHADDVFTSWGLETPHKYTKDELAEIISKLDDQDSYGYVLRAKGIVDTNDDQFLYFDYVPGECEIRQGAPDYTGKICVIGSNLKEENLKELFK